MQVRYKGETVIDQSSQFNTEVVDEVIIFGSWGADSAPMRELEVLIDGKWKDLNQAFTDRDLIRDNYNTRFFEPPTPEDKARGYTL